MAPHGMASDWWCLRRHIHSQAQVRVLRHIPKGAMIATVSTLASVLESCLMSCSANSPSARNLCSWQNLLIFASRTLAIPSDDGDGAFSSGISLRKVSLTSVVKKQHLSSPTTPMLCGSRNLGNLHIMKVLDHLCHKHRYCSSPATRS